MFYQFDDEAVGVDIKDLKDNALTVGYIGVDELMSVYKKFAVPLRAAELCTGNRGELFSCAEYYDGCAFIRLGVLDDDLEQSGCVGVFALKNTLLFVNIGGSGVVNRDLFMKMMARPCNENAGVEQLLSSFFDCLVVTDDERLEAIRKSIAGLEEAVINNSSDARFNVRLLELKRKILRCRGYYERLIDISQALAENDNEIFTPDIKKLSRFTDKVKRLKDNTDILTDSVVHLWDAYQASLNMKLNEKMKFFTLVTTLFFPLTVIVGWYGMNFSSMPEFGWKYGYAYVIIFSVAVIAALLIWFKKRKWF